ncbi:hypothetical protein Tco_1108541 [Tanacetum coccineum]
MSVRSQAHILFPSKAEVARLLALPTPPPSPLTPLSSPLPQIPPPPTSPTNAQAQLGYRTAMIRAALPSPTPSSSLLLPSTDQTYDLPEAYMPLQKRARCTAPAPRRFEVGESSAAARQPGSTVARKVDYSFMDASIRASERRIMAAIEVVNLRGDHAALRDEVDTLRMYLSSLCTTHEQERAYRHEWQRQDADDHATRSIMRIQALKAGARVDTFEDTGSSA